MVPRTAAVTAVVDAHGLFAQVDQIGVKDEQGGAVALQGGLERNGHPQHGDSAANAAVAGAASNQSHGMLCRSKPVARLRGSRSHGFVSEQR